MNLNFNELQSQKTAAARADEEIEDEDDDMKAQENQKILEEINESKEKNNGKYYGSNRVAGHFYYNQVSVGKC